MTGEMAGMDAEWNTAFKENVVWKVTRKEFILLRINVAFCLLYFHYYIKRYNFLSIRERGDFCSIFSQPLMTSCQTSCAFFLYTTFQLMSESYYNKPDYGNKIMNNQINHTVLRFRVQSRNTNSVWTLLNVQYLDFSSAISAKNVANILF